MAKRARKNLIAGEWRRGEGTLAVSNPYTSEEIGRLYLATPEQVEAALDVAESAFRQFRVAPAHVRVELLSRLRQRIGRDAERIAQLICAEAGKPITFARGEVGRGMETLKLAAEEARRLHGEYLPLDPDPRAEHCHGFVRRVPRGPATALWPFNFPLNLLLHKIGPALAAGCPVLMRPPSATPLTGLRVAKYLHEELESLGLPPGVVQFIACTHETAEPLIEDPRVSSVSFTGSDMVGWDIKQRAPKKQVLLELGGQAGMIIEPDAPDLAYAAKQAALGAFAYAGQVCISVQRIMVNRQVYDKFMPLLLKETKRIKTGNPEDEKVVCGPLIDDRADNKISLWIDEAVDKGARVLTGRRLKSRVHRPYLLEKVKDTTQLYCGEAFGPVAVIETYNKIEEAIALTNGSRFGLQSAVFSSDINKVMTAWRDMQVGGLIVNEYPMFRVDAMPYGGVKDSGFGREGVRYAIEEYTEPRLMVVRHSE
jgi:glyceraldehyde-3-phosphate dehydrogenase (NADP+)